MAFHLEYLDEKNIAAVAFDAFTAPIRSIRNEPARRAAMILGKLPLREYLGFEPIWPNRTLESVREDCKTNFGNKRENSEAPLC